MFNKEKKEFNTLSEFENRDIQKVVKVQSYEESKYGIEFSKLKKGLIIFGLSIFLLNSLYKKKMYVPQVNINMVEDEFSYFAEYSLGKVYICKDEDFDRYKLLLEENDILIIDKRNSENPDMCIYNSYKIKESSIIMEVLLILEEYEKENPSNWNRTLDSMYNEWIVHNICYGLNYRIRSTEHVDLDNEDEAIFSMPVWKLLLNRE